MRLAELAHTFGGRVVGASDPWIRGVQLDSRRVARGDLFVALPGTHSDGARYALDALARGAEAVLAPEPLELRAEHAAAHPVQWLHPDARRIAGLVAAKAYGEPARSLFTCAVTGTNGKTTSAHLIGHLLQCAGRRPAVLGTAGNRLADGALRTATHTTPDAPELMRLLAEHRELGGDCVAMEVSSHALAQERTSGIEFDVAVFTNLTRDHLDYHGDFASYARAKEQLFRALKRGGTAVLNADQPYSERMAAAARTRGANIVTYSAKSHGDLHASHVGTGLTGSDFVLQGMGIPRTMVVTPLCGRYNVENVLAALACALVSGASPSALLAGLATASGAPGRLERVPTGERGFALLVDYAHSEDALDNVCRTLRETLGGRQGSSHGRLIVVFGCGGDRDRGKRPGMGRVVNELADVAIVTSDNPRSEDPAEIAREVVQGMQPAKAELHVELDRAAAIRAACRMARAADVVLIAGKGHETTQTIGSKVLAFDDRQVAAEVLR